MQADHLFGMLNLSHWDLFDIWLLVLGILKLILNRVLIVKSEKYMLN